MTHPLFLSLAIRENRFSRSSFWAPEINSEQRQGGEKERREVHGSGGRFSLSNVPPSPPPPPQSRVAVEGFFGRNGGETTPRLNVKKDLVAPFLRTFVLVVEPYPSFSSLSLRSLNNFYTFVLPPVRGSGAEENL